MKLFATEQIHSQRINFILAVCVDLLAIWVAYKLLPEVIISMSNFGFIGKAFIWSPRFSFSQFICSWLLITMFVSLGMNVRQYLAQNRAITSKFLLVIDWLVSIFQIIVWFLLSFVAIDVLIWYLIFSEDIVLWEIKVPIIYIIVFITSELLRQRAKWRVITVIKIIQKTIRPMLIFLLFLSSYLTTTFLFGVQMLSSLFISGIGIEYLDNIPDWVFMGYTLCLSAIILVFTEILQDKSSTIFANFLIRLFSGKREI